MLAHQCRAGELLKSLSHISPLNVFWFVLWGSPGGHKLCFFWMDWKQKMYAQLSTDKCGGTRRGTGWSKLYAVWSVKVGFLPALALLCRSSPTAVLLLANADLALIFSKVLTCGTCSFRFHFTASVISQIIETWPCQSVGCFGWLV